MTDLLADLFGDIRYGWRMLVNNPGFTVVAVVSLALGIGFNTAIFSAVDSLLLKPKMGLEPERLVELYLSDSSGYPYGTSSYPDYREYRDRNDIFTGVAAFQTTLALYRSEEASEYVLGEIVTGNFFELLGIPVILGRPIQPTDDENPGGHPVAVLGERFWRSRLGADQEIVGTTIDLNGRPYTVIGVTALTSSLPGLTSTFFAPAAMADHLAPRRGDTSRLEARSSRSWFVKARLDRGVGLEGAQAQMDALSLTLQADYPDAYREREIHLLASTDVRLHPLVDNALFPVAFVLMAVVGLVLLIACANVANMALARASSRRSEVAIRMALGSSRWRLARQLLTESVLLSGIGGVGGVAVAMWSTRAFLAFEPPMPLPVALDLGLNLRVLLFTFVVSVGTGVVFGLAPALQASRLDLVPALKSEWFSSPARSFFRRFGLRNILVVVQVAVSLVLLIGAALMLRSAGNAQAIDPGFEMKNVVMVSSHLSLHGYDEESGRVFYRQALEQVTSLPEIETASLAAMIPLGMNVQTRAVAAEGREPESLAEWPEPDATTVSPHYFETMSISLIRGRDFSPLDLEGSPRVVIVNETLAREFWPNENPVGKRVVRGQGDSRRLAEVVGIVRDTKVRTLGEDPRAQIFFPASQDYSSMMYILARTRGNPDVALAAVRERLLELDASLAFFDAKTMEQNLSVTLFPVRMGALLLGAFGLLALVLASVGLYGLVAYSVSRRTREIGIRMALGAARADVVSMVTRQGLELVLVGCALGLVLAGLATRVVAQWLYGVGASDVGTFAAAALVLIAVASLANWIPARRASRIEPVTALHYE